MFSDMDIGILLPSTGSLQDRRSIALKMMETLVPFVRPLGQPRSFEIVRRTKVPLIRYVDNITQIEVDLSVQWDGFDSVPLVIGLNQRHPAMLPVVKFIKALLLLHGLNVSRDGGLHGFGVLSMTTSIVRHLEQQKVPNISSGLILMTFLHFYGFVFDPNTTGIDNANNAALLDRVRV
jgi:DNA polymerase sigma